MTVLSEPQDRQSAQGDASDPLSALQTEIEHAAHLLPSQGPIAAFVHHNTLHMFEHHPFDEAVKEASAIFGCQVYLPETRYREHLGSGRIAWNDVQDVLREELGEHQQAVAGGLTTRYEIRSAMLRYPFQTAPAAELRWMVAETDALTRFRDESPEPTRRQMVEQTRRWIMRDLRSGDLRGGDLRGGNLKRSTGAQNHRIRESLSGLFVEFPEAEIERWSEAMWEAFSLHVLWRTCRHGVHGIPSFRGPPPTPVRHRDLLLEATGSDSDLLVSDFLIRFCAAFLDQGLGDQPMPGRELGLYRVFCRIYSPSSALLDRWLSGLGKELQRLQREQIGPLESIRESLALLGVMPQERERYLAATLLALRGWAGMIWQLETEDSAAQPLAPGTLVEYLAVRLILERLACQHLARKKLGFDMPLAELRRSLRKRIPPHQPISVGRRAFQVFQLAQLCGWSPEALYRLPKKHWGELVREIESFGETDRRRLLHQAYERRYRNDLLDAVAIAAARPQPARPQPRFQAVFCIDDREESFRRHLEEVAPDAETFSVAGFYAVAMHYRGAADAHFSSLCPVIIRPDHYVEEEVHYTFQDSHRRRAETRRALGVAQHRWHLGSRTFLGGMAAGLLGSLASIPLVMRVLFPRATTRLRRMAGQVVQPPPATRLQLRRWLDPPGPEPGHLGYTWEEMAAIVRRVLFDIGLTREFARLVIFHGHGSSSMNNPHESAYNCGACSGGRGGPNARAFAQMANDPRVRTRLAAEGLWIPDETVFLAAYHNTCDESVTWYDLDALPATHREDFEQARRSIDRARQRNAHERCRWFESASLSLRPEEALRHVESRAEDLSEARPEYNHATNAVTIVGRRSKTRGLFLDRRAFLNSYDPSLDDAEHTILARILQAAIPVCAGISLEYYFSCVDPEGWGCGSKLPHNLTSLLGVMSGAASDLRPGLSAQMVEIHEPMRQLFVVETTPDAMLSIMARNEVIGRLVRGHWVQLATLDPDSAQLHIYGNNGFVPYAPRTTELPRVTASAEWYRGWRGHLEFALIDRVGVTTTSYPPACGRVGLSGPGRVC